MGKLIPVINSDYEDIFNIKGPYNINFYPFNGTNANTFDNTSANINNEKVLNSVYAHIKKHNLNIVMFMQPFLILKKIIIKLTKQ